MSSFESEKDDESKKENHFVSDIYDVDMKWIVEAKFHTDSPIKKGDRVSDYLSEILKERFKPVDYDGKEEERVKKAYLRAAKALNKENTNLARPQTSKPIIDALKEIEHEQNNVNKFDQGVVYNNLLFIAGLLTVPNRQDDTIEYLKERYELNSESFPDWQAKLLLARDVGFSIYPVLLAIARSKLIACLVRIGLYVILRFFKD